jgi:hypothetical protein
MAGRKPTGPKPVSDDAAPRADGRPQSAFVRLDSPWWPTFERTPAAFPGEACL